MSNKVRDCVIAFVMFVASVIMIFMVEPHAIPLACGMSTSMLAVFLYCVTDKED